MGVEAIASVIAKYKKCKNLHISLSLSLSLSLSPKRTQKSSPLSHLLFSLLQSNTPIRTIQHRAHTNTPTQINQPIAYGSMAPTEMPFVGQRKWISGSVVEISISRSTRSVDQCLWSRLVLVEEITACGGDQSL